MKHSGKPAVGVRIHADKAAGGDFKKGTALATSAALHRLIPPSILVFTTQLPA